jgi:hypothetical protein
MLLDVGWWVGGKGVRSDKKSDGLFRAPSYFWPACGKDKAARAAATSPVEIDETRRAD